MTLQKILVVDDEAFIADLSRTALGEAGYEVFCAYSGEQAVEQAMKDYFDLTIVDAMLPGMTGLETFEAIRQINPSIPGILVSGHANMDMLAEAENIGLSKVLQKPVASVELVSTVEELLAPVVEGQAEHTS